MTNGGAAIAAVGLRAPSSVGGAVTKGSVDNAPEGLQRPPSGRTMASGGAGSSSSRRARTNSGAGHAPAVGRQARYPGSAAASDGVGYTTAGLLDPSSGSSRASTNDEAKVSA